MLGLRLCSTVPWIAHEYLLHVPAFLSPQEAHSFIHGLWELGLALSLPCGHHYFLPTSPEPQS